MSRKPWSNSSMGRAFNPYSGLGLQNIRVAAEPASTKLVRKIVPKCPMCGADMDRPKKRCSPCDDKVRAERSQALYQRQKAERKAAKDGITPEQAAERLATKARLKERARKLFSNPKMKAFMRQQHLQHLKARAAKLMREQ